MSTYRPDPDDPWTITHLAAGYVWCRPHEEWHRPPECAINEQGQAVDWEGKPW